MLEEYQYGYLTKKPKTDLAFLPVGSIEIHGGYIPFETDTIIAQACAFRFAQATGGVLFPPVHAGVCANTDVFDGTVGVSIKSFFDYIVSLLFSLHQKGFSKIILVNIHNGNDALLKTIVDEMYMHYRIVVYYINAYTFLENDEFFSDADNDYKETSLLLASCEILGICIDYSSPVSELIEKNQIVRQLKKHGHVGYSYDFEKQHIAPRTGVDVGLGMRYIEAACEKMPQIVSDLDAYIHQKERI